MENHSSFWIGDHGMIDRLANDPTLTTVVYLKDTTIYHQGFKNDHLYYIIEGRVRVAMMHTGGEEKTLAVLEPGSFINENGFLRGSSSPAAAYTLTKVKVVKISRANFRRIITQDSDFATKMMLSMSIKIRLLTIQVEYLAFFDNRTKLAIVIKGLASDYGRMDENGVMVVDFPTTDQELGNYLGVRREAITKILSRFKSDGILDKKNRCLHILDPAALDDVIEQGLH